MDHLNEPKAVLVDRLSEWYSLNQRSFPWRYKNNPYLVLVSEVLLQQTNAEKVVDAFNKITTQYRNIDELAEADIDFLNEIFLSLGLFYRARRLIDIAKQISELYEGNIPDDQSSLLNIKGIGEYISSSVMCFGFGLRYAVVDTNVIRIFERFFQKVSDKKRPRTDKEIWSYAQSLMPAENYVDYNYALLDFGSLICTARSPKCGTCILNDLCIYYNKFDD